MSDKENEPKPEDDEDDDKVAERGYDRCLILLN